MFYNIFGILKIRFGIFMILIISVSGQHFYVLICPCDYMNMIFDLFL